MRAGAAAAMVGGLALRVVDLVAQALLVWAGALLVFSAETDDEIFGVLITWCLFGSLYWLAAVIVVSVSARRVPSGPAHPLIALIDLNPFTRFISSFATFAASLIGVTAAVQLLLLRGEPDWRGSIDPVAVWAMLLSWALFHWGFARIYERRYRRAVTPPLEFPKTPRPRLADFVYFAFTNATAFSVSDVNVTDTRMRWTVVWHTTLSFFLNALLIVLVINTITASS
ncbi:hypothetical protein GCM10009851_36030 [Herbiconiux moechotypicola]|uniref:DUF1345 domain-containing protein n=1 Tax=Herbiconiux moechotypicola TaxID=637393 RepID=A0ABN3E2T5_9MICO|nr:DUF1345 domain-containing protein [Herbiconiux moechotypicola]